MPSTSVRMMHKPFVLVISAVSLMDVILLMLNVPKKNGEKTWTDSVWVLNTSSL